MSTKQTEHLAKARLSLTPEVIMKRNRKALDTRMRNKKEIADRLEEANRRLAAAGLDTV